MTFRRFDAEQFATMADVTGGQIRADLETEITELRTALGEFFGYHLDFVAKSVVRPPNMRCRDNLVFGRARAEDKQW